MLSQNHGITDIPLEAPNHALEVCVYLHPAMFALYERLYVLKLGVNVLTLNF